MIVDMSYAPKVSVVIPTYRHLSDCLIPCCESIKKFTDLSQVEVIVVANGCGDDGTKEYVQGLGHPFKLIWIDEPMGYTKSTNIGIKASTGEFVILLNNDIELLDQVNNKWIEILLEPFSDERVCLTGPMKIKYYKLPSREFIIFFCACVRRSVLEQIGYLDEIFSPGYAEDIDAAFKMQDLGYKICQVCPTDLFVPDKYGTNRLMVGQFPMWHKGNETFGEMKDGSDLIIRNDNIILKRYGGKQVEERPMIYNIFSFNDELDLLEERFKELYSTVDRFVIAEGSMTFAAKPKPYHFRDNLQRFEKYLSKVTHIMVDDWPDLNSWTMEKHQRNRCMDGLRNCKDNDIIVITDADELPTAEAIQQYKPGMGIQCLVMDLYYYNLNTKAEEKWRQPKIVTYDILRKSNFWDILYAMSAGGIENAGKHCSWFGDVDAVIEKFRTTAHREIDTDEHRDRARIERVIKEGIDILERPEVKFVKMENIEEAKPLKFNLGSGGDYREGYVNVDISHPKADVKADLNQDWSFAADNSADAVFSSNTFEHLHDKHHTMNELYRILKIGAEAELIIPSTDGRGAWQDPTHVSYWNLNSWQYWCNNINPGLTSYNQSCGFRGDFECTFRGQMELPENVIMMRIVLKKVGI